MRIDQYMVESGLAPSRAKAQELISLGRVTINGPNGIRQVGKSSTKVDPSDKLEIIVNDNEVLKYVARSGLKLEGALRHIGFDVSGLTVLDIGQSTGGFTDCLIQLGADKIVGVDVGHGQLHSLIKENPKVTSLQGVNARSLADAGLSEISAQAFDLVVMDVSFISMTQILPSIYWALKPGASLLSLVKPQFELSRSDLSKKGVVKNPEAYARVEKKIKEALQRHQFNVLNYFDSSITGGDGNREFFVYASRN